MLTPEQCATEARYVIQAFNAEFPIASLNNPLGNMVVALIALAYEHRLQMFRDVEMRALLKKAEVEREERHGREGLDSAKLGVDIGQMVGAIFQEVDDHMKGIERVKADDPEARQRMERLSRELQGRGENLTVNPDIDATLAELERVTKEFPKTETGMPVTEGIHLPRRLGTAAPTPSPPTAPREMPAPDPDAYFREAADVNFMASEMQYTHPIRDRIFHEVLNAGADNVLEVGCNIAIDSRRYPFDMKDGPRYTGVDFQPKYLERAKELNPKADVREA